MATVEQYAEWLVANENKRGTPDFETVAQAYRALRSQAVPTQPPAPAPEKQSVFRQVADVPLGVAKGAVQGVRMIADAFGAGSSTSNTIRSAENYLADLMSAQAKNDQQAIARIMKDAEDKGVLDQVRAGIKAFTVAPVDTLSSALGTAAPIVVGALGAKIIGAGAVAGTGISALLGGGMGAGVVKGSIYDETKKALLEIGAAPEEAERRAQLAQEYGGKNLDQILLGTALGGVAALGPLEKGAAGALARRILGKAAVEETGEAAVAQAAKSAVRRRLEAGAKEALPEMAQAAQEQVAQNIALQREGFDVPTMRGAVGAATLEGIAGGALGAGLGGGKPEIAQPQAEVTPPAAPPAVEILPPTARERVEEITGVTAPPAGVTPMTAEEAEAAGAQRQREIAERARIGRLQEMVDADAEALAERARREGIQPVVPPRAPTPERTVAPLAERQMPQATPEAELQAKQAEIDRRRLEAGLPTGESSMFPGFQPRPPLEGEPPAPAAPAYVDERPMTEKAAKNRLLVIQNLYKNSGRDPESVAIVPHPTVPERFAIQSLDKPVQLTPRLPETAAGREPSPRVLDPVEAYVNVQRRTNTESARRFVQDWEAGRITRADVEQALEQEKKTGQPAPLTFTKKGEPELMEPEKGYRARQELPPYLDFKMQLRDLLNKGEPFFVDTFTEGGVRKFYASPFETLKREERTELVLSDKETQEANKAQDELNAATTAEQRVAAENRLRSVLQPAVKRAVAEIDKFVPPAKPPVAEEPPPTEEPPTGEEPPQPTVEPPKTVGELRQRLPVSSDNAKLRAANNNGSFEDLANALAASPNAVTARVGQLAKKISKEVKLLKPKSLGRGIAGVYNRMTDTVQMAPGYVADEWVNTHEVVHALVARSQVNPTPRQKPIVKQLDELYEYVYKETKRRGINPKTMYGLTNSREFASEAMSNSEFQFYLMGIPYKGKRNAWTEFTRIVANLLGFKDTNALSEAINLVDRLAETKRAPFSTSMFGQVDYVVEAGQPPILDTTGLEIKRGRHPQLVAAATLLSQKKISREEYDRYVNFYKPIEVIESGALTPPTSDAKMYETVDSNKTDSINAPVKDGQRVGLRMDIPARNRGGMVVSIHEGASGKAQAGTRFSFQSTGHLTDVTFEPRSQKRGLDIAMGKKQEPLQTIEGAWINTPPEETFKRVKELMSNPNWVQVGFDPTRHGYFYDRKTKQPVVSASEVYQIGNFVLAKDAKYAPTTDFEYMSVPEQIEEGQPPVLDTTGIKDMKGRHKQMIAAARLLRDGKISRAEYDRYVNFYKPIATIDAGKLEAPAPIDTIKTKIDSNLQKFVGAPVADGTKVGLRLDIKARDRGAAVVTVHEGKAGKSDRGSLLSYLGTGYIKDVTFEPRSQARGLAVAAGGEKFPLQTSEGTWFNVPPDEVFKRVKELMNDPNWVQVGFDPTRHGYFYDRNTKQPVKSASEMYQVGNFLLAKDVTYAPIEQFDYAPAREEAEAERPTLAAGATPMDIVGFMGIKPQKQEEGIVERTKRLRQEFKEDPELTKSSIAKAVIQFKDKMENNVFSSDAAFNNKVRSELIKDIDQNKDVLGTLIEMSQSQTVHSDAVAGVFLQMGGLRYDNDAKKWVGFQEENNFINLSRKVDEIAKTHNLSKDEAMRVAHAYFVAKRLRSLQDRNAEIETKIANLPKGDPEIKKLRDSIVQIHLDDDQIQAGLDLEKQIPELRDVVDVWNGIRSNTVKLLVQSGMWTEEFANDMLDNIDYVPFYREEQLEEGEGPAEFVRGLQVKAKEYRIKGSENPVNDVFDNMMRWTQYAVNRAIRNHKSLQLIDTALDIDVDDGKMAEKVKEPKKGESIVRVFRDGKQEYYRMADPLFMDAFLPVQNVTMPSLKILSWFANMLRQSVVLFPLFSVAQVPQDAFAAMFTSGLQPKFALRIPYLAAREYVQTLTKTSALHNQLKKYGVVGVRDFSSSVIRDDAEIMAGLKPQQTWWGKSVSFLQHVSMSADNAVRQAVYDAAMQQGLSKAEALEKAFDIINFRRKPKSLALNIAGQTIPFFYAYLAAQRVAYNTLSGVGISPQERKAGWKTLMYTSAAVMALSMLYAMLNEDDEDYRDTPTALRDRTITIPGSGGVRIPLRVDFFLFPKVIAEHAYHHLVDSGMTDKTKFLTSMKDAVLSSILAPGPFPQAVKAPIEVAINYDFYQGRPLIGYFDQKKDAERQFNINTSEFGKVVGSTGLISPIAVDHLMRGMFGSVGGLFLYGTNKMINTFGPDVERPTEEWQDAISALPSAGAFLKKSTQSALKNDFYQLRDEVEKVKNTFNDYKNYSPEGIDDFIANEDKMAKLALSKQVEKISDQLAKVRKAVKQVTVSPMMTGEEKQEKIRELREIEKEMLKAIDVPGLRKAARL